MISLSEKTIPLYILSAVLDKKNSIGVMFPSSTLSGTLSNQCSAILNELSIAYIKRASQDSVVIETENGSKIYFISNLDYCRGLRLNEYIFIRASSINREIIESTLCGFMAVTNNKDNTLLSVSHNDIILVKRKYA